MNISYNWLKEYVDFDLSAEEVAKALTSIGLEVDDVEEFQTIKGGLKGIVVGEVLTCEHHPNSDHMHVCSVDLGEENPVQIVCGAANIAAGQKVMVATIGTTLYDGEDSFKIKKSKLRGVESFGMICAEDEIGVGTDHNGIIVLPVEAQVGTPAAKYYELESDYIIGVDITPNRSDACSHYGVARDLYAWLVRNGHKTALHRQDVAAFSVDNKGLDIDIRIDAPEGCPRYCAVTLSDCEVKESPTWLKNRLSSIGVRPINNIVDITNYVMFAYGQPLHCFDADMVKGNKVIVRTCSDGEPFVTLDGEEHKLDGKDLAICNAEEPMCIAGILGGKGSGTYETTKNILFESAYFNPTWIRKSARHHGISTDASFRFERGIDPEGQIYALKVAAMLAKELSGGKVSMEIKEVNPIKQPSHFTVDLTYQYIHEVIGIEIPVDVIKEIVTSLEMKIVEETERGLQLLVPSYRVDVQRPCDVVEDILRIYGYNNVGLPKQMNTCLTIQGEEDRSYKLQNLISEQLVGQGFNEIMNNSLTKESYYTELNAYKNEHLVHIMNPLSGDLNVLRQTLFFGGMESITRNVNRKTSNLRFFEIGKCYRVDAKQQNAEGKGVEQTAKTVNRYSESYHLGLWITGKRVENNWAHPNEESSVFELKGYVQDILVRLGLSFKGLKTEESDNNLFSKGLVLKDRNDKVLLEFGVVARRINALFDLDQEVYFADLHWDELMRKTAKNKVEFVEIAKYPSVSRDLALLVDKTVKFAEIERIAFEAERKLLKSVTLFDVYEGKNLGVDKKSYAVNFTLQDENKTLNDKQTEAVMNKIIQQLQKQLNATLR